MAVKDAAASSDRTTALFPNLLIDMLPLVLLGCRPWLAKMGSSRRDGQIHTRSVPTTQPHRNVRRRIEADVLEIALARIGAGDDEAQAIALRDHLRDRRH